MDVIAIYPGRFHPFHKGHAASFKQLASKFGLENTYLAISAKQEQPKSPFSASDRAKMANSLGIPSDHILVVNNPYNAKEYIDRFSNQGYDPEKTVLVFGVSKKDMEGDPALGIPPDPRFSFQPKKDGSPSYLQPFTTKGLKPMTKHGYILSTDVAEFPIAGQTMRDASAIRKAYAGADDKTKMKILHDLYGDAAEQIKSVFDNNLQVTESILRLINKIKPMISEATLSQKAKFVKLLSEAKSVLTESNASGTIGTPMKQVQRDPRLKIVQEPNKFYSAVDKSDPRPALKPNMKLIQQIDRLEQLFKDLVYARDTLRDEIDWPHNEDPRLNKLSQQIGQVTEKLKLLYGQSKHLDESRESSLYNERMANIIDDLGDGYFLGDDSYYDDEGFEKEGYTVYYLEGPDQYRKVDYVNISPYPNNRKPGDFEKEIHRILGADKQSTQNSKNISENIDYLEEK